MSTEKPTWDAAVGQPVFPPAFLEVCGRTGDSVFVSYSYEEALKLYLAGVEEGRNAPECPRCGKRVIALHDIGVCVPCAAQLGWDPFCEACDIDDDGKDASHLPHIDTCSGDRKPHEAWKRGVLEGRRLAVEELGLIDAILPDGTHRYYSTHCRHGDHEACSATVLRDEAGNVINRKPACCKGCGSPCTCPECKASGRH